MSGIHPNLNMFVQDVGQGVQLCDYFDPYELNGGSLVALEGPDFATIACDTRLSSDFSICTRSQNKLFQVGPCTVMGAVDCWCDALGILDVVKTQSRMYEAEHSKPINTIAFAQMLSVAMYSRRFFPYFVSSLVAGIDTEGKGAVFAYDAVGHVERSPYRSAGTGLHMITPALDTLLKDCPPLTINRAMEITAHSFIMASERDIFTGDSVIMNIITKDGIECKTMPLRND